MGSPPTRSQVLGWHPLTYNDVAAKLQNLAKQQRDAGNKIYDIIARLNWSGKTREAAVGRAVEERASISRIADTEDNAASVLSRNAGAMDGYCNYLNRTAGWLAGQYYNVSETWDVTDDYPYPSGGDDAQQKAVGELRQQRADVARDYQRSLKETAQHLGDLQQQTADALKSAAGTLKKQAPPIKGVNGRDATRLLDELRSGKTPSPAELAELQAATGLSADDLTRIAQGQHVDIPQNQYTYLHSLMEGMNGMSVEQITRLGAALDPQTRQLVQGALANSMQIMSNPQIGDKLETAGMSALPPRVQSLLKDKLVTLMPVFGGGKGGGYLFPRGAELRDFTNLMTKGDPNLRMGTDIDRGLNKQAAELAGDFRTSHAYVTHDGSNLQDTLNGMLAITRHDTTAAADFVTGHGMEVTVTPGGHYDPASHVSAIMQHEWDGSPSAEQFFNWQANAATQAGNPFLQNEALQSAGALGHILGGSTDLNAFGQINPHMALALASNMQPFLGDLAGGHYVAGTPIQQLSTDEMARFFQVLDSSPQSAAVINHAGDQWQEFIAYQFGHGVDPHQMGGLGTIAGTLQYGMTTGYNDEMGFLQHSAYETQVAQYNDLKHTYDLVKLGVGLIPGGDLVPFFKALAPDSGLIFQQPAADLVTPDMSKLAAIHSQNMETPVPLKYAMLLGYMQTHGVDTGSFPGLFNPGGSPDWNRVIQDPSVIDRFWLQPNSPQANLYTSWHIGYDEGQSATPATPIPVPGQPR